MLTEEQAKERWCPFSRYSHQYEPAANRWKQVAPPGEPHALNPVPCRCIASACMAWRSESRTIETGRKISANTSAAKPSDNWYWRQDADGQVWVEITTVKVGYCGMAGRPE